MAQHSIQYSEKYYDDVYEYRCGVVGHSTGAERRERERRGFSSRACTRFKTAAWIPRMAVCMDALHVERWAGSMRMRCMVAGGAWRRVLVVERGSEQGAARC